jgi:hypothetical protein
MTTEKDIRNWFGDRGYPIEDNSKLKFKVLNSWLFILDREYDEIELYETDTIYCEPYTSWDKKGFNWSNKNLQKLIPIGD